MEIKYGYTEYDKPIPLKVMMPDRTILSGNALGKIITPSKIKEGKIHVQYLVQSEDGSGVVVEAKDVLPD